MKKILSLILCLALLACLTGCGANSAVTMKAQAPMAAPREEAAAMDMASGINSSMSANTGSTVLPENRKWIITVHLTA